MGNTGKELVKVIKDEEIQRISTDLIESVIDSKMAQGVLKELPLLSTFFSTYIASTSIQDKLFLKKLLTFLYELKSVSQDERINQIIKIEDDSKYKTKVGEKLLFIMIKCDDLDKVSMVGRLFKYYLGSTISYDEFLSCVNCIERTPLPELMHFIEGDWDELNIEAGGSELVSYGLMEIRLTELSIKISPGSSCDHQDKYAPSEEEVLESKLKISGFTAFCYVTPNGELLRNIYGNDQDRRRITWAWQ